MTTLERLIAQAEDILDQAFAASDISHIVALLSGGHDSAVSTDVTMQWAAKRGIAAFVMSIDTRTGISENETYVRELVALKQWPWQYYHTPERYSALVMERGFPGSPMHQKMFDRLKGRCIDQLLRDYAQYIEEPPEILKSGRWGKPKHTRRPMMLTTGVRKNESAIRMGYKDPAQVRGAAVWTNPIFWWTATNCADYMDLHSIPRSPVVDKIHRSGDCQCGANAHPGELDELNLWYGKELGWLRQLEQDVYRKGFVWGWNDAPPKWWGNVKGGQEFLSPDMMMLCVGCTARGDDTCHVDLPPPDMDKLRRLMEVEGEYRDISHIGQIANLSARKLSQETLVKIYDHVDIRRAARILAQWPETIDFTFITRWNSGMTLWESPRQDYTATVSKDGVVDIEVKEADQLPIRTFNLPKRPEDNDKPLIFPQAWPRVTRWCALNVSTLEKLTEQETEAYKTSERWRYLHDYEETMEEVTV